MRRPAIFGILPLRRDLFTRHDALIFGMLGLLVACLVLAARGAPETIAGPAIALSPRLLPIYAGLSLARMAGAYVLSLAFTFLYGSLAARSREGERFLIPLLDVLQSIPLFSFLPLLLFAFMRVLAPRPAVEMTAVVLLFTCMGWNIAFSWYQSLITLPQEYRRVAETYRLGGWIRFRTIELPFGMVGLTWNSMLSWSNGWFFLMAAEMFTVGSRDFRLPGLGSYLQEAAAAGDLRAVALGLLTVVLLIAALDQVLWTPLIAFTSRFSADEADRPSSWFYDLIHSSRFLSFVRAGVLKFARARLDALGAALRPPGGAERPRDRSPASRRVFRAAAGASLAAAGVAAAVIVHRLSSADLAELGASVALTFARTAAGMAISLAWAVPAGIAVGLNRRLTGALRPVIQVLCSIPATAFFPVLVLWFLRMGVRGLDVPAVLLMAAGSQWYILFNVVAGASAIPDRLRDAAESLRLGRAARWRILVLPAVFPYLVTGMITAWGASWNVSIVAEYASVSGTAYATRGLGSLMTRATASGDYQLLFAATISMILAVVLMNRLCWRPLYTLAEEKYRLE